MKSFTEFIAEASKPAEYTGVMSPSEMKKHIGDAKFKAIIKHPWYKDNFSHQPVLGMKYERNNYGHEIVHVAHGPTESETPLRRMAQFQLSPSGRKVENVHMFHNFNNETHKDELKWKHVKSLHSYD